MKIEYRLMKKNEIEKVREIKRKEEVNYTYYVVDGELNLKEEVYTMEWSDERYKEIIKELNDLYDRKGTIFGAFDNETLVGFAALESRFMGIAKDQLRLSMIQISNEYRGHGIGTSLMNYLKLRATEVRARKIYITAARTKNTIDFYLGIGCKLASEVDQTLSKLYPKDIALELKLNLSSSTGSAPR